jgi:hypothetical protein
MFIPDANTSAVWGRLVFDRQRLLDSIDSELRLLAAVRWSIREHGGEPSSRQVDELLNALLSTRPQLRSHQRRARANDPGGHAVQEE